MFAGRTTGRFARVAILLALALQASASGQVSIRLDGVPDRLSFPFPDGVNQVLTVTATGGEVTSMWLAPSAKDTAPSRRTMLTKVAEGEYQVNLAGLEVYDLLNPHGPDGEFRIFAETPEGKIARSISVRYTMAVLPGRLDFHWDEAKLTIYQRTSRKLPGIDGSLRVFLGDITGGQVAVSVSGPHGKSLIDGESMQQGDTLALPLPEQEYVLRLDKLVNLLFGEDYGVFSIMPSHAWEGERIDHLLQIVSTSGLTFIRNDYELPAEQFAAHLRQKYEFYGPRNASVTDFIEKVATRSSTTGRPYRVKLPSGDTVDAPTWLKEKAANALKEPKQGAAAEPRRNEGTRSKRECRLDSEGFARLLDRVETSGVTLAFGTRKMDTAVEYADFINGLADLERLHCRQGEVPCFDQFVEAHVVFLEARGETCQVRLPDGQSVLAAPWFREQVNQAAAGTEAGKDATRNPG